MTTAISPEQAAFRFSSHEKLVNEAWDQKTRGSDSGEVRDAVAEVIEALGAGQLRAASRNAEGTWTAHTWLMRATLLSLQSFGSKVLRAGDLAYFDQPGKFSGMSEKELSEASWRIMPPTTVRRGVYLGERVFLLPCFINSGAYIGEDTMIDGFANIGTCAQIGNRVHISTCVGIGGVAEPMQPYPVIIEDDCFIGANSSIVEGMIIEEGSVIGMGVQLGQSTKILDRATGLVTYGRIPRGSVVVSGSMPSKDGTHSTACAVIVKRVDAKTREKTSINELFRT